MLETLKANVTLIASFFHFLHKFLFWYDYFRIPKLCGIEFDVNFEKQIF